MTFSPDLSDTLIIIPTFNERDNAPLLAESLYQLYPGVSLLFIDDNSPDQTGFALKQIQPRFPTLGLIERTSKLGLGTAYALGFKKALESSCKYIVQMDCDFSHDPKDVLSLIVACQKADVAIGSRYYPGGRTSAWPWQRKLLSKSAVLLVQFLTGLKLYDATSGFKCFRRETLEKLATVNFLSKGYIFQTEVNFYLHSQGAKITEIPILFAQRTKGQSKMHLGIITEALKVLFKLRFSEPERLVKKSHH